MEKLWYAVSNAATIPSPALIVYPDRLLENIRRAIRIAGDPRRLRPHLKTHKCPEIVQMHLDLGVTKFKCSTIAELEMAARAGAHDLLLAYQLTGPNLTRFQTLRDSFPSTRMATICDNEVTATGISRLGEALGRPVPVYLDLDCGMHRTGIEPDDRAFELYRRVAMLPGIEIAGLHVYDGQIHDADPTVRERECAEAFAPVEQLRARLEESRIKVPAIVAGGTPTFPIHAAHPDRECSPGTYVFWDFGYRAFADLDFEIAAVLLARVISKPGGNRLCIDLGYKAVASENPPPRVEFLNLPDATAIGHSEEHLVIETSAAPQSRIGDVLYGVPRHICPTVAHYDYAWPARNGRAGDPWRIEARTRRISL